MSENKNEKPERKNIILLSDGTGNSASKLFKTNVWRLYQALDLSVDGPIKKGNRKQIAYYDDGVGTASFKPLALFGGAFGWGTKRIVLDLYTFLCRHYKHGDCIYGFGFSRGAFAIRLLTGFITSQGLVKVEPEDGRKLTERELRRLAADAFRAYRAKSRKQGSFVTRLFRGLRNLVLWVLYRLTGRADYDRDKNIKDARIKFLGLWDTVAAYGLPIDELTHAWNFIFPLSFPDRNLSRIVDCAYHALAIDDERLTFHPDLWNEDPKSYPERFLEGDRLTQVWFAGMHSNVGGGYPDDGLSGVPLNWIMDKAESKEVGMTFLQYERDRLKESARIKGKMYDSRRGLGGAYRYMPRKIHDLTHDNLGNDDHILIETPKIHEGALLRIRDRVEGYAPIVLPEKYDIFPAKDLIPPEISKKLKETPAQTENRVNGQENVWNLVWWKRVFYFISIGVFGLLATFPLYRPARLPYDGPLYIPSKLIGSLGAVLPGFLSTWLEAFQSHPGLFLLIAVVFAGIIFIGSKLQDKIFDNMRITFDTPEDKKIAAPNTSIIYRLQSSPTLGMFSTWFKEKLVPTILAVIIVMLCLRGIFLIMDSSGFACRPNPPADKSLFPADDLCWYSGVDVEECKRYRITITTDDTWKDASIPTSVYGHNTWYLTPFIPFRRHLTEPWSKPIARIGDYGGDEYPLNPAEGSASNANNLIAEIKARRSGRLYLFVNDAVLPVPRSWQYFYRNNRGAIAHVAIEPLPSDSDSDCCDQTK